MVTHDFTIIFQASQKLKSNWIIWMISKICYLARESRIQTTPGIAEAGLEFEHLHDEVVGLVTASAE